MDYTTYLIITLVAGSILFGFAASVLQDQLSRATESFFDSVEYALAVNRKRRMAARQHLQHYERAAASSEISSASLWGQQQQRDRSAA